MILYDNNFEPVGISQDILNFLGYDDMDDFRTYATDIADLFIKKSGFIHSFDDFSWIQYVLHSGAPNKSALVRLKNGKEKELKLSIKELFLFSDDENSPYYEVDIVKNVPKHDAKKVLATFEQPTFEIDESKTVQKPALRKKQEVQKIITQENKFKTKKKSSKKAFVKPVDNSSQNNESQEKMFIENLSEENLSFLKTYELPKIKKRDEQKDIKNTPPLQGKKEDTDSFIKEFLDYNDLIVLELLYAVNQKDLQSVKKYVINLLGISQMLQLEDINKHLELLKNSKSHTVQSNFEEYQELLEELRRKIEC